MIQFFGNPIYIMKTGVGLSICLSVRLCVTQLLSQFWTEWANKDIYEILMQRARF